MTEDDTQLGRYKEVFSLLAHEIRIDILLASLRQWQAVHTEPQRYSELMRAVGIRDSGKFNYHLNRLRGAFVHKTEDGYVPTGAATALYRAVIAHRPTETVSRSAVTLDRHCLECESPLELSYERDFLTIECPTCEGERHSITYPLPANAFEGRTDDELARMMYDRARAHISMARSGQCPECAGTTTRTIRLDTVNGTDGPIESDDSQDASRIMISCDTCRWEVRCGMLLALLPDARVAGGLAEVDVPVDTAFPWELPTPTVQFVDDSEITLTIKGPTGAVEVIIDYDLNIHSVSRV